MPDILPNSDAAVTAWMQAHGWPVTGRHYDVIRAIYAWRSDEYRPVVITLWITRDVVDDQSSIELVRLLDAFKVDQRLAQAPEKFPIIRTADSGPPELIQLDELPK